MNSRRRLLTDQYLYSTDLFHLFENVHNAKLNNVRGKFQDNIRKAGEIHNRF